MNDDTLETNSTATDVTSSTDASSAGQSSSAAPAPARQTRKRRTGADQVAADATLPQTIPATKADPEPAPPCAGSWLREADGGLRPRDEGTARAAGLAWPV